MPQYKIVETDNYGGDYPDEKFVENLPYMTSKLKAEQIAEAINSAVATTHSRFWKVVEMPYELQPGFEP